MRDMLTLSQHERLQKLLIKPWVGSLTYFRLMKADWDRIEALGFATKRQLPATGHYGSADLWEYTITEAGRVEVAAAQERFRLRNA
jgi:hypothetical protein